HDRDRELHRAGGEIALPRLSAVVQFLAEVRRVERPQGHRAGGRVIAHALDAPHRVVNLQLPDDAVDRDRRTAVGRDDRLRAGELGGEVRFQNGTVPGDRPVLDVAVVDVVPFQDVAGAVVVEDPVAGVDLVEGGVAPDAGLAGGDRLDDEVRPGPLV